MMANCNSIGTGFKPSLRRTAGECSIIILLIFLSSVTNAQHAPVGQFQLAPPAIDVSQTFFSKSTSVRLDLDVEGVILRYALGDEEVSENSAIYKAPIAIRESTTIKAMAFHPEYKDSDIVQVNLFRMANQNDLNVSTNAIPAPQYAGEGTVSLLDQKKGSMNFRDGRWLGFSTDTIVFDMKIETKAEEVTLSVMEDHGSWIFAPNQVEIWEGTALIGSWASTSPNNFSPKSFRFIEIPFKADAAEMLQMKVIMHKIPEWHDGKGTTPWLFIDEIFISN